MSVVIPIFNDTTALAELIRRLYHTSDQQGINTELLLVDDGSTGTAWENLKSLKAAHMEREIILLRLAENSGQHNATLCGLLQAKGDVLITMDADLQHPPEAIPLLLSQLQQQKLDLVYGSAQAGHPWPRRFASKIFKKLTQKIGAPAIHGSAFRVMRAGLVRHLTDNPKQPFTVIDSILRKKAAGMASLTVEHHIRRHGKSSYNWSRLVLMAVNIITGAPQFLYLLRFMAACMTALGTMLLWASMMSHSAEDTTRGLGLFLGGALLLLLSQWMRRQRRKISAKPRFTLQEEIR
ncbi:MAG: glycosyltransferase [Moraxellaceae bacterium]